MTPISVAILPDEHDSQVYISDANDYSDDKQRLSAARAAFCNPSSVRDVALQRSISSAACISPCRNVSAPSPEQRACHSLGGNHHSHHPPWHLRVCYMGCYQAFVWYALIHRLSTKHLSIVTDHDQSTTSGTSVTNTDWRSLSLSPTRFSSSSPLRHTFVLFTQLSSTPPPYHGPKIESAKRRNGSSTGGVSQAVGGRQRRRKMSSRDRGTRQIRIPTVLASRTSTARTCSCARAMGGQNGAQSVDTGSRIARIIRESWAIASERWTIFAPGSEAWSLRLVRPPFSEH